MSASLPPLPAHLMVSDINPHLPEARRRMYSWAESFDLLPGSLRQRYENSQMELLAAYYYPNCDLETFSLLVRWMLLGAIHDDLMDDVLCRNDPVSARQCISAVKAFMCEGKGNSSPLMQALENLWHETRIPQRSTMWQHTLARHWEVSGWEALACVADDLSGRTPPLQEYLERRRVGVTELVYVDLLEVAERVDLQEHVRNLPSVQSLGNLCSDYVGLCNDLLSLEKDLRVGGVHNAVTTIRTRDRCTLDEAVERVKSLAINVVDAYVEAESWVPAQLQSVGCTGRQYEDVMRYAHAFRAVFHGNREWHMTVARFADQETKVKSANDSSYGDDLRRVIIASS
ncbi:terpene synthase family protein [Streptomyces tauricus]|uniref:terpene synthase family protein n=1 Tax=Streptomyces tauricus TaxID=68274 RepID=UPI0022448010|nr:hypothetical protein [Streptomyces tauricus]MCW8096900.1 terpene synthase family protein [Streptomyces tauricus]